MCMDDELVRRWCLQQCGFETKQFVHLNPNSNPTLPLTLIPGGVIQKLDKATCVRHIADTLDRQLGIGLGVGF